MNNDLWSSALRYVYAHPDAPEGIEFWQVNSLINWRPAIDSLNDASPPESPREGRPSASTTIPGATEVRLWWSEGEVSGVPFGFAWSREMQRVFIGFPASHE